MSISRLFTDTVTVRTRTGTTRSGTGGVASPVDRACYVNDKRQLVLNANGEQIVSDTTLYDLISAADLYAPGSQVTVRGREMHVVSVARHEHGPGSAHHIRVTLS